MFSHLLDDIRYSLRALAARRMLSLMCILTLALGIGANTAIFSVVNGLLLKPLPYAGGERLVQVFNVYPKSGLDYAGSSIPDYLDRKAQAEALEDLALYTGESFNLALTGTPERLVGLRATPSLFSTLGASAEIGRVFGEEASTIGQDKVAVISHALWKNRFAGDREIVGRDIRLNGERYQVVGVMPASFAFPNTTTQLWVPFAFTPEQMGDRERGNEYSESIGRLRPGASVEQLDAQLDAIILRNADRIAGLDEDGAAEYAEFFRNGGMLGGAKSLRDQWVGELRPVLWMLQAVVLFVLLIACANVANLMLTRVSARQKELSVRSALGASRARIVRQVMVESLILALAGSLGALVIAYLGLELLDLLGLSRSRLAAEITIDPVVLGFTLTIAVATGLIAGILPAVTQMRSQPYGVLKEGGRGNTGSRASRNTRSVLVVVQIALAVTLMIGAGLMIRSFSAVQSQDPGFARDNRITVRLDLRGERYAEPAGSEAFYRDALVELRKIPGVRNVSYVSNLPFGQSNWTSSFDIAGRERAPGEPSPHGFARSIDGEFFKAMDIPILQGRSFEPGDTRDAPKVIVVDELFAKKHFPDGNVIGQRMERDLGEEKDVEWTIVGVVGTVKNVNLTDEMTKESYYFDYRQLTVESGFLVLDTTLPAGGLVPQIRDAVQRVDPEQPIYDIKSLDERIAISLESRKAPMTLLMLFAGVALMLSTIGIYGVLASTVQQRTGELGLRMAIGAQKSDVLGLVLKQGARLSAIGLVIGLAGGWLLTRFMEAQLFNIARHDPVTLVSVVLALGSVALLACWLPARRASRIDPLVALRYE